MKAPMMRIAVFDHRVVNTNAIGRMTRMIIEGLSEEHKFTVFAVKFDNPYPDKVEFVRVPAIPRPLFAQFTTFLLLAPLCYLWYRLRHGGKFDLLLITDVNALLRGSFYTHFCHAAYLRDHWKATRPTGLRRWARWLDHKLHALVEPILFRLARQIIVPSQGLAREITSMFGAEVGAKIQVIGNAVDVKKMIAPADFDRAKQREAYDFDADDLVLSFMALGHFERKGFPLLLEAIQALDDERVKLLVIGGTASVIADYTVKARDMGIADQLRFVGTQQDTRPYLWISDVFAFPSAYETFSVATFEASAAQLPILISRFYGAEDYLVNGVNGWLVERDAAQIAEALRQIRTQRAELKGMGQRGAEAVASYDPPHFLDKWQVFLAEYSRNLAPSKQISSSARQGTARSVGKD